MMHVLATGESIKDDIVGRYTPLVLNPLPEYIRRVGVGNIFLFYANANFDGLRFTFEGHLNTPQQLRDALEGHCTIVSCDVSISEDFASIPVITKSEESDPRFPLHDWIHTVLRYNTKGVQIFPTSQIAMEKTLHLLRHTPRLFKGPVIIRGNVLSLSLVGAQSAQVNPHFFLYMMTGFPPYYPCVGWETNIPKMVTTKTGYPMEMLQHMGAFLVMYKMLQPLFMSVHASVIKYSIEFLQTMMLKFPNMSLLIESARPDNPIILEDFLEIRNRFPRNRIFYDIPTPDLERMFAGTRFAE